MGKERGREREPSFQFSRPQMAASRKKRGRERELSLGVIYLPLWRWEKAVKAMTVPHNGHEEVRGSKFRPCPSPPGSEPRRMITVSRGCEMYLSRLTLVQSCSDWTLGAFLSLWVKCKTGLGLEVYSYPASTMNQSSLFQVSER